MMEEDKVADARWASSSGSSLSSSWRAWGMGSSWEGRPGCRSGGGAPHPHRALSDDLPDRHQGPVRPDPPRRDGDAPDRPLRVPRRNFELSIALAFSAFAATPTVAVSTVVGPLIEVPVMLGLTRVGRAIVEWARRSRHQMTADRSHPTVGL